MYNYKIRIEIFVPIQIRVCTLDFLPSYAYLKSNIWQGESRLIWLMLQDSAGPLLPAHNIYFRNSIFENVYKDFSKSSHWILSHK